MGLGRADEARAWVEKIASDASRPSDYREEANAVAFRIAHRTGAHLPATKIDGVDDASVLLMRAATGEDLPAAEIGMLPDQPRKAALGIAMDARTAPDVAIQRAKRADDNVLAALPDAVHALLGAEAVRRGEPEVGQRLAGWRFVRAFDAMAAFVLRGEGEWDEPLAALPLEIRAALSFVRSRVAGIRDAERAQRLADARSDDVWQGAVAVAMANWKP